ncbi:MAG: hypothetical protein EPN36_11740, partial [Rhodanobacteraceae bacterium]
MNSKVAVRTLAITLGMLAASAAMHVPAALAAGQGAPTSFNSHRRACSVANLRGTFGLISVGSFDGTPFTRAGWETFDGKGYTSGTATNSVSGTASPSTFIGTYTVNADCTGTLTVNDSEFGPTHYNVVIVDAGRGVMAMCIDPGANITLDLKKQFPGGDEGCVASVVEIASAISSVSIFVMLRLQGQVRLRAALRSTSA